MSSMTANMQSCWACGNVEPPGTVIDCTTSLATALALGWLVHAPSRPVAPIAATTATTARRWFTAPGG